MKGLTVLIIGILVFFHAAGQEPPIVLKNASFEGKAKHGKTLENWYSCSSGDETSAEIHPNKKYGVTQEAYHGETYAGLIVRNNKSRESLSQELSRKMEKGKCYSFSFHTSRSREYREKIPSGKPVDYVTPVKLKIWGGQAACKKEELLAETNSVGNFAWEPVELMFTPMEDVTHITIEPDYVPTFGDGSPYNGHVMIDNASLILPVTCPEVPSSAEEPKEEEKYTDLDTLQFEQPNTEEALKRIIMKYGPKISFASDNSLEKEYYRTPSGDIFHSNTYLHHIVEALRAYPKVLVIAAVNGENEFHRERRSLELNKALEELDCPTETIIVRPFRSDDTGREWMWPEDSGAALLMRYIVK